MLQHCLVSSQKSSVESDSRTSERDELAVTLLPYAKVNSIAVRKSLWSQF